MPLPLAILIFWLAILMPARAVQMLAPVGATIEATFGPGKQPAEAVAAAIDQAKADVRVMTYQLSNGRIINALRAAAGRGVAVQAIVDGRTCATPRLYPIISVLTGAGASIRCDEWHPILHHKVMIIDGTTVITGSFNFSPSAERNGENVAIIRGFPALAEQYLADWQAHWDHANP